MERLFKLRSDLESVKAVDETVILDDDSEQYFATNPAGTVLWESLKDGATVDALAQQLVDTFEIELDLAQTDAQAFINQLDELNMLEK